MRKTIYIILAEEKMKLDIASIFSRIYAYAVRICISLFITYLVTQCLIAVAYAERGYKAVGGEYMMIPVVFFVAYKLIGLVMKFLSAKSVKAWKKRK